jgi:hypothetical protein
MFEQLEQQHATVYNEFQRRRRGRCGCRSGEERSYVVRRGELGCQACLQPEERGQALHLDTADLKPATIREACSGDGLRRQATESLQAAFADRHAQLLVLEQRAIAEMPEVEARTEGVAVLQLQIQGKREVAAGRMAEGYTMMKDSWEQLHQAKRTLNETDGVRIRENTDRLLRRINNFGLILEELPAIGIQATVNTN